MHTDTAPTLKRSIGLVRATAMVVGTIVGASIFVQPSVITGEMRSVAGVVLVWTFAGLLTLVGALICAELASAYPESGGVYVFLREEYSPALGFLWGWAMFWSMHSGIIAAIAVVCARFVGYFMPLGDSGIRLVAIAAILVLSAVNYIGVAAGSGLQAAFTIAKIVAIAGVVAAGFWLGAGLPAHFVGAAETRAVSVGGFAAAVAAGLFAYGGWHMVTYTAEETREPRRVIPRALAIGTLIVTAVYVALNAVYLYVLPVDRVIASDRVAADVAAALLGPRSAAAVSGLVAASAFGALAGIVLTGPRVYFSMARDGLLFRWAGGVHPRFGTPHRAIVLQAVWSAVLVATGTYRALFTRVVFTEWLFFAVLAAGLVGLRRRAGYAPAYRVPGAPVLPLAFAAAALFVAVSQIAAQPRDSAVGLLLVLAGLPVYAWWTRRRPSPGAIAS
ncbi:MAG TPA: amino acid permease [Gemmatimonadales bacterium]|nr:amino acid permease [Gemmatimonadales bacterium]